MDRDRLIRALALLLVCLGGPSGAAADPMTPIIDSLIASSVDVLAGSTVTLTASAHDPAGSAVLYAWAVSGGALSSASGSSVTWTAPGVAGPYTATLTVSNGQASATSSLQLTVALTDYQGSLRHAFRAPRRIAVARTGEVFVLDAKTGDVARIAQNGDLVGHLKIPERMLAIASGAGGLYASSVSGGLYAIDTLGGPPRAIALRDGPLRIATGLAFDAARGVIWIAEGAGNRVRGVRLDGSTAALLTSAGSRLLTGVTDVAFDDASGVLWVSQDSNEQGDNVHAFDGATGGYLRSAAPYGSGAGQVTRTGGIAVDPQGRLFVSDIFQGRVQVYQRNGTWAGAVGQFAGGAGQLQLPAGMAVAPDGALLVASMDQGSVQRFGTGSLPPPRTCAVDGQVDSDCDGMPDSWELKYGLDPGWAGDALALSRNGDGLTNLQEYVLGRNPNDPRDPPPPAAQKPVITVPAPKTSDPGLVRFSTTLVGPPGCTVRWRQRLGLAVTLRGADGLNPSFVARKPGRYEFQGAATCGGLVGEPATLEATIRDVAPRADAGRLIVAHPGDRALLDGRFSSDANGDALALTWEQTLGAPLSGAAAGAELPLRLHRPGYFEFQLTATDPGAKSGTAEAAVLVVSGVTPAVVVVSPLSVGAGAPVTLQASATADPAAGTAAWRWAQVAGPPAALDAAGTATPTFTPAQPGHYAFEVVISAGGMRSPPARVEVYAGTGGALPVARAAQPALTATVGEPLALDGRASTASGGGRLRYVWSQASGPAAGLTDSGEAVATIVPFTPGAYVFELSVSEDGVPGAPAQVTVLAVSTLPGQGVPRAVAAGPATAVAGVPIVLDGTASTDPDGHQLSYRWTQVAGPWVALDEPNSATPSFVPPVPGVYRFELEVDDQRIRSAPASVSVTVSSSGAAP